MPSGDHRGAAAPDSTLVMAMDSPPVKGSTRIWGFSFSAVRTKAMRSPAGLQVGALSAPVPVVRARGGELPSVAAIQRFVW